MSISLLQRCAFCVAILLLMAIGCEQKGDDAYPQIDRSSAIPESAAKMGPSSDLLPPVLHTSEFRLIEPVPGSVNTAGAEDSPYVSPNGQFLYFFFTPDVRVPATSQVGDQVSGLYVSSREGAGWGSIRRIWLQQADKLALDGAACVQGDTMWFASAREGYTGVNIFTAKGHDASWRNWVYAGRTLNKTFEMGEVHAMPGNSALYFHSSRSGGRGGVDIWYTELSEGVWQQPVNVPGVNSSGDDSLPFVTPDGKELWFTRIYQGSPAIYRSRSMVGGWGPPQLMVSQFAAEPSVDSNGDLYFAHHFFRDGVMLEADIYVARR